MADEESGVPEGDAAAERPLNRAEKRALAHNKKKGSSSGSTDRSGSKGSSGMGQTTGRPGNVSMPRTGHK